MTKTNLNLEYIKALSIITKETDQNNYIVLGSMATLSFTSEIGYTRKMNDLDIIADRSLIEKIKIKLIEKGFTQTTFINKRMPFYKKLIEHSRSTYLRFSKDDINIEILVTKFIEDNLNQKFDLYPNFWVQIPKSSFYETKIGAIKFTTLDVSLLWAIKYLLHNSLGKFMSYKEKQRTEDLLHLRKLVNLEKAKKLLSQCRFGLRSFSFTIPSFFLR